jgi:hypothetical protein
MTNTYSFELRVDASAYAGDIENTLDQLYDAGLDDALVEWSNHDVTIQVDREAASPGEAIVSAIAQADSVAGLNVIRVEPSDLVSVAEIARRKGKTKQWASMIVSGKRGPGGFPPSFPLEHLSDPMWRWDDVDAWFDDAGRQPDLAQIGRQAMLMSAINAVLDLRKLQMQAEDREVIAPLWQQVELT